MTQSLDSLQGMSGRFLDLDTLLPRPGPAGAQNKDIATLGENIEKDIIEEIKRNEMKDERRAKRRLRTGFASYLYMFLFRLEKEKKEMERALKECRLRVRGKITDGTYLVKKEERHKPSWSRYAKRIIRRIKIERVESRFLHINKTCLLIAWRTDRQTGRRQQGYRGGGPHGTTANLSS